MNAEKLNKLTSQVRIGGKVRFTAVGSLFGPGLDSRDLFVRLNLRLNFHLTFVYRFLPIRSVPIVRRALPDERRRWCTEVRRPTIRNCKAL